MTQQELRGYVERISFRSQETGFTVARLAQPGAVPIVIVGVMTLSEGEQIVCKGNWKEHPSHGRQFEVVQYEVKDPEGRSGIENYLATGPFDGVGPAIAEKIVGRFGEDTLRVLDTQPERLQEIPGLGKKKLEKFLQSWRQHRGSRKTILALQNFGMTPGLAGKLHANYGEQAVSKLCENPYQLMREIGGIGFKTADVLAKQMGIPLDASLRIEAGIHYGFGQLSEQGHTCFPLDDFLRRVTGVLEIDSLSVKSVLGKMMIEKTVFVAELAGKRMLWSATAWQVEHGIVAELRRIMQAKRRSEIKPLELLVEAVEEKLTIVLADKQREALQKCFQEKVTVVTGGPGTGKSTLVRAILLGFSELKQRVILAAPTGRAAKRLNELTHHTATTIHALLEFDPVTGLFQFNRKKSLSVDAVVVDEMSMVDAALFHTLLRALPDHVALILVGDRFQLPSVGPGQVLKDLLAISEIARIELDTIFRQAAGSKIVQNAHEIRKGHLPNLQNDAHSDFFFLAEKQDSIPAILTQLLRDRLPKAYGFDPVRDIQVLSPQRKGLLGTNLLNETLQVALNLNAGATENLHGFVLGDKVMQMKNRYEKSVLNGDIGFITQVDRETQTLQVKMTDERTVKYEGEEILDLTLAYASTVHKFQGSECPCVVMIVDTNHQHMLARNLLYTAVTRAQRIVVLIGSKNAVAMAVGRSNEHRQTGLQFFWKLDAKG